MAISGLQKRPQATLDAQDPLEEVKLLELAFTGGLKLFFGVYFVGVFQD